MSDLPLSEPAPLPAQEVLDIQHDTDPADDHGRARRIPHLGHTLLFFALIFLCMAIAQVGLLVSTGANSKTAVQQHPALTTLSLVIGYLLALAISFPLFRLLWHRTFLDGISWTARAARLQWRRLMALGFLLTLLAQLADRLFTSPKGSDLVDLFGTPAAAWLISLSGSFIIPAVEEIAFRGFLLPSLATAYDWLTLKRTPAALDHWHNTTSHSGGALVFAAVLSSIAFAGLHGFQLHGAPGPLAVLFLVSMVLSVVRIRTRSVACSALVHSTYNLTLFVLIFLSTGGFRHLEKLAR